MYSEVRKKADLLVGNCGPGLFAGRKIGLEKECLRVSASGGISQRDHPDALGRALTHPYITTDFSEALLEMVTPPCDSASEAMEFLTSIHQFIVNRLPAGEHIWNTSMPCILRGGQSVRIGEYGTSHSAQMKHAYRRGLGLRYGRRMQAIAGVHFNFSMPECAWNIRQQLDTQQPNLSNCLSQWQQLAGEDQQMLRSQGYFQMMQNLLRVGWIVPYLFGASPAICASFLNDGEGEEFEVWNGSTRYAPFGTSLRMGKIGYRYREDQPIDLSVRHTSLDAYIEDVIGHVSTEHPAYKAMGLLDEKGEFQQLSTSRLQIENEFYSTVRPKQIPDDGELPIHALRQRGIRYLELRSVDVDLAQPNGLGLEQIAMLEMLMMFAWLATPAQLDASELQACTRNVQTVAHRGREPGLQLEAAHGLVGLGDWGKQILETLSPIAHWLDQDREEPFYVSALDQQMDKLTNPDLTPSAIMLQGIKQTGSFFEYAQSMSRQHHDHYQNLPVNTDIQGILADKVTESFAKQSQMESDSHGDFKKFLDNYLNQIKPEALVDV
ncbi:MAG: glutamate--cysteine ligase [Granulosicoccus sp.]